MKIPVENVMVDSSLRHWLIKQSRTETSTVNCSQSFHGNDYILDEDAVCLSSFVAYLSLFFSFFLLVRQLLTAFISEVAQLSKLAKIIW